MPRTDEEAALRRHFGELNSPIRHQTVPLVMSNCCTHPFRCVNLFVSKSVSISRVARDLDLWLEKLSQKVVPLKKPKFRVDTHPPSH